MFERFTSGARAVVTGAQEQARGLGHGYIGCEHLVLAVADSDTPAGQALRDLDVTPAAVRTAMSDLLGEATPIADRDALASIGIDLDAVRARVEAAFGPGALTRRPQRQRPRRRLRLRRRRRCYAEPPRSGHIPFTPRAKKCLELALREAVGRHDNQIGVEHLALALTAMREGLAPRILARLDVSPAQVRWEVERRYRRAG
jgi:ATP-dependent Clp protease ATP-binding subunit ClpA